MTEIDDRPLQVIIGINPVELHVDKPPFGNQERFLAALRDAGQRALDKLVESYRVDPRGFYDV